MVLPFSRGRQHFGGELNVFPFQSCEHQSRLQDLTRPEHIGWDWNGNELPSRRCCHAGTSGKLARKGIAQIFRANLKASATGNITAPGWRLNQGDAATGEEKNSTLPPNAPCEPTSSGPH